MNIKAGPKTVPRTTETRIGVKRGSSSLTPAAVPSMGGAAGKSCVLCGGYGHSASAHRDGKAVPESPPDGPAREQAKETSFGINESDCTTGSPDYKLPGWSAGESTWIFG